MNEVERRKKIKNFVDYWSDGVGENTIRPIGERKEYQNFWNMLLQDILEVNPYGFIEYEKAVAVDGNTKFIDGYIKETRVLIEQKGSDIDLDKEENQSGGIKLTPAEQARRYVRNLSFNDRAKWMVVSNFKEIRIFDMNKTGSDYEVIKLKDLETEWYRLRFLVDTENEDIKKEMEVSVEAGRLVGKLYDALYKQYKDMSDVKSQRSLNILCVRIVFCLYAEDAGLFGDKQMFYEYLKSFKEENFREALINLFKILNENVEDRDKYLNENLLAFPYVNGGLFAETNIEIPKFDNEIIDLILNKMSEDFDWSKISPTIFGAIFESTLNPDTRRAGGMHYTSIENIHKVIDPLFLNDLKKEFDEIKEIKQKKNRDDKLKTFQDKISNLKFLDPAAGSGNFLTETYIALREIENEIIKLLYVSEKQIPGQIRPMLTISSKETVIKVNIGQFYGIEINDFAVTVANTALWIAEYQTLKKTEDILNMQIKFLPLRNYNHIVEGNALTLNWNEVVGENSVDYIMGNPPFVGGMLMTKEQKKEIENIFVGLKGVGEIDYVCCWYKKACDLIKGTNTKVAFVSTNSICQGQSVITFWKWLVQNYDIEINFAYRSFVWNSESNEKAKVHCVIVGFSNIAEKLINSKVIYENNRPHIANNISAYLVDAEDSFIEVRATPICDVPAMKFGNMPRDGGGFILTEEEKLEVDKNDKIAAKYVHLYLGAEEFINNKKRFCIWLQNANPKDIKESPFLYDRVKKVKEFRMASKASSTRKMADTPALFAQIAQTDNDYILVPETTSSKRNYIPIGFMTKDVIASNLVFMIPNATLYNFGVLTSNVHMAWMRLVCGRLGNGYRYSKDIVYNNFPWPNPSDEQRKKIEETAQGILDARAKFPDSSLADLYDETTMPDILRKAHRENDKTVMKAYGFKTSYTEFTEEDCVAELMKLYKKLTS